MKKLGIANFAKTLMLLWKLMISLAATLIFYNFYIMCYEEASFFYKGNVVIFLLYAFILVVFVLIYGGYKLDITPWRELLFSYTIGLLFADVIIYFVLSLVAKTLLDAVPLIIVFVLQFIAGMVLYPLANYVHLRLSPAKRTLAIISDNAHDMSVLAKLNSETPFHIVETRFESEPAEQLLSALSGYKVIVLGEIGGELREKLGSYCYENSIRVIYIPSMHDIMFRNTSELIACDSLAYMSGRHGFSTEQLLVKRLVDIFVSVVGLVVASPFMVAAAIAIKLQDKGPVLFKQRRLTRRGRVFMLYKFRSMVVDAEKTSGARLAGKNDSRITRVGRLLRAARIDELPQLINILKGDMTLVGPRPERPELFDEICKDYPDFRFRLGVKAGLTGYAQLYGKYNTTFEDKVKMDVLYIERASLLQDLQLILYTFKIIFMRESTEGVDDPPEDGKPKPEKESVAGGANR